MSTTFSWPPPSSAQHVRGRRYVASAAPGGHPLEPPPTALPVGVRDRSGGGPQPWQGRTPRFAQVPLTASHSDYAHLSTAGGSQLGPAGAAAAATTTTTATSRTTLSVAEQRLAAVLDVPGRADDTVARQRRRPIVEDFSDVRARFPNQDVPYDGRPMLGPLQSPWTAKTRMIKPHLKELSTTAFLGRPSARARNTLNGPGGKPPAVVKGTRTAWISQPNVARRRANGT